MGRNLTDVDIHVEHYLYLYVIRSYFFFLTRLHKANRQRKHMGT